MFTLRRGLYSRLARRPGPVEITSFAAVTDAECPTEDVLAEFRRTLAQMSLSTPQSIPTEPQRDSILDDVRTALDAPKNAIATAAALLGALVKIRTAYRVSAQLRVQDADYPYGITVHVVMLPGGRGEVRTIWSDDWVDVAERAAHLVGAFVLPRSRLARRPPWTAWHGLEMPGDLFHHTQTARRFVREKRYEEAIDRFHRALEIDPQNPYLRIELAQVQEQIGLYMDALSGYADVVAIESWYDRRLWLRLRALLNDDTSGTPPGRLTRARNGRGALVIARYRLVCRLAAADQLSEQWERSWSDDGQSRGEARNPLRATERKALRERLSIWLDSYYRQYVDTHQVRDPMRFVDFARKKPLMRHFLQFVAHCEATHLVSDYRWVRGRRRPGLPVTQTALNVMLAWAPLYLIAAQVDVPVEDWSRFGRSQQPPIAWPPDPNDVDRQIAHYLRRKPAFAREWQEYYNAACTCAVALGVTSEKRDRVRYALRAVRHLERAVSSTDSGFVGSYAQWLSTGDSDLSHLRSTPQFIDFLDRYLPNEKSRVPRPRRLLQLIMSMHCVRLLQQYARARADFWRTHADRDADAAVADELNREWDLRVFVLDYAQNDRDWRSRLRLIEECHAFARRRTLPEFVTSLPSFQDDPAAHRYLEARRQARSNLTDEQFAHNYYNGKIRKRNRAWPRVAARSKQLLREAAADAGAVHGPVVEASEFWRELDETLTTTLYGADATRNRSRATALARPPVDVGYL